MKQQHKINTRQCGKCKYGMKMGEQNACGYILVTGRMRGCPVNLTCEKFERRKEKKRPKKSASQKICDCVL